MEVGDALKGDVQARLILPDAVGILFPFRRAEEVGAAGRSYDGGLKRQD